MNKHDVQRGKRVALEALLWAMTKRDHSELKQGELREGVRLLFGREVDLAVQQEMQDAK